VHGQILSIYDFIHIRVEHLLYCKLLLFKLNVLLGRIRMDSGREGARLAWGGGISVPPTQVPLPPPLNNPVQWPFLVVLKKLKFKVPNL